MRGNRTRRGHMQMRQRSPVQLLPYLPLLTTALLLPPLINLTTTAPCVISLVSS